MPKRLEKRRAVVTGGSNGIGRAIAISFAREGADVVITFKSDHEAARTAVAEIAAHGVRGHAIQADLSALDTASTLVDAALAYVDPIDIVVSNVGTLTRTAFLDIRPDEFDLVLNTDLRSPFFLTQAAARHMIARGIQGSIILVSSLSAERAVSRVAHYQSAKAGLNMLTKSAAYELAPHGIRVNTLAPGLTATKGNRDQWAAENNQTWQERKRLIPLGRTGMPEDHAGAAVFLASDESAWMTGGTILIDGGLSVV